LPIGIYYNRKVKDFQPFLGNFGLKRVEKTPKKRIITPRIMGARRKIFFIIPAYNYFPEKALAEISKLFQNSGIILINDNPNLKIKKDNRYILVRNSNNLGLAKTLETGYLKALELGAEIIIKIDPDLEYPPSMAKPVISDIESGKIDVGFVHFPRRLKEVTFADYLFHNIFRKLEGFFIGERISQHSPGLQVYRASAIKAVLKSYSAFISERSLKWGGDLLLLKLSKAYGLKVKGYQIPRSWIEKRSLKKIFSQGINTLEIITSYKGLK
jgi:hypothetical protein